MPLSIQFQLCQKKDNEVKSFLFLKQYFYRAAYFIYFYNIMIVY